MKTNDNGTDRDMTTAEIAEYEQWQKDFAKEQKQRDKNNNHETNLETKTSDNKAKPKNKASQHKTTKPQQNHAPKPVTHKKSVQSPESLQLEIKKLELEIAQLKLEDYNSESSQEAAGG